MEYPLIAIFRNNKDVIRTAAMTLKEVLQKILNCDHSDVIDRCRELYRAGDISAYDKLKDTLPGFTICGIFEPKRAAANLKGYSRYIILDIDKLDAATVIEIKQRACAVAFTFCCFISPSGIGLKIIVRVSTDVDQHKEAYQQLITIYEKKLGVGIDRSGSDVSRLCYFSCDKEIYIQEDSVIYTPINTKKESKFQNDFIELHGDSDVFEKCIQFTENIYKFEEGSRNSFIYLLANNCNRQGLSEADATSRIKARFNYDNSKVSSTIQSAYKHNSHEFGKFAKIAKPANLQRLSPEQPQEDFLKNTPVIPESLYLLMPKIIRDGAMVFNDSRERDVLLTGTLAILSGCLPGVKGSYAGQEVFPNLFSFTVAPSASGKGALKFAKMLADEYHHAVLSKSREAEQQYEVDTRTYKQKVQIKGKNNKHGDDPPVKPAFKVVYIPANSSYAKILLHLEQNAGVGIICETEADTLANVFKQEWGSYSDLLRKAFHHERISSSRKTNNEFIEVDAPSLSVALSGTPGQVTGLIASAEDGLFSRFLFYAFKVEQKWKDVSPNGNNINLTRHFKQLSRHVYGLVQFLQQEETLIDLTNGQWNQLNKQCEAWLNDITMFTAEEAASIVKRLGLILYRITMLFTAIRKFENGEAASQLFCTDEDFNIALQLAGIYLHHSILMFNNLPKQTENNRFKIGDKKRQFVVALPQEFTRKQAVEMGKKYNLSESTVSHFLPKLVGSHFTQPKPGHYSKIK